MKIDEPIRRYIFSGMILLVVVGFIIAIILGNKQDRTFQKNEELYRQMLNQIQETQYDEALLIGEELINNHRKSDAIYYLMGLAAANSGDVELASEYLRKSLDVNPYQVEDPMFMLQYGEILLFEGKNDEASLVLEHCMVLSPPETYPDYLTKVEELQKQLGS